MIKKPVVPEHVCPYADLAVELIELMIDQEDKAWRKSQATMAIALVEHMRVSAEKLRISSKFWYDKSKREPVKPINRKKSTEPGSA